MVTKLRNHFETTKHKLWVAWYLLKVCLVLVGRAIRHDLSKYGPAEAPYFERVAGKLRGLEYGSEAYKAALAELGPALEHHYRVNSHHPEHWSKGVNEMGPLDLIEMMCDWKAAGRRHNTGSLEKSLKINKQRFGYGPALHKKLEELCREVGLL